MSQQLILELSEEVYAGLQQKASAVGLSIAEWSIAILSYQNNDTRNFLLSAEQKEKARQRFRNHAGSISLGFETGVNNEGIDADLARAYASEYEG
jgi:hypothetical protein